MGSQHMTLFGNKIWSHWSRVNSESSLGYTGRAPRDEGGQDSGDVSTSQGIKD